MLFDASHLPVEENLRQTIEVVAEARQYGAHVEGEIESITGVEDGIGSDTEAKRQSLDVVLDFIERTEVDVFAPVDRQRPRLVQAGARARLPAGQRHPGRAPAARSPCTAEAG